MGGKWRDYGARAGRRVGRVRRSGTALRMLVASVAAVWLATDAEADATTVYAAVDNRVGVYDEDPRWEHTVYWDGDLMVGCWWTPYVINYVTYHHSQCWASLIWFDIDGLIAGKTIQRASLRLFPYLLPWDWQTTYGLGAISTEWHWDTVTWANQPWTFGTYVSISPPFTTEFPMEFDVTGIVQKWADGDWLNWGFKLKDNSLVFPGYDANRITGVESMEYWFGWERRPQLYLEIAPPPPPAVFLEANPTHVAAGEACTLSWQALNAYTCCFLRGIFCAGSEPTSGSKTVYPQTTTTWALSCAGEGGRTKESVTVTVPEPAALMLHLSALGALAFLVAQRRRSAARD